jgi:integrase
VQVADRQGSPNHNPEARMLDVHLNRLRLAGYREETIRTKRRMFGHLETFLHPKPIELATRLDLENWLARPELKAATRKAYRSHLRAYYRWLVEEGHRDDDPTYRIPPVRVPRALPRPIPSAELGIALAVAPPRMRAWLLLMCLAGLRCCEVARLCPDDVMETPTGTVLFIREAKGGGQGTVPAVPDVLAQLNALPVRDGVWWRVKPNQVSVDVSAFLHSIGINATGHQLRHWAGTEWYGVDRDLISTQRLLRHASLQNTQVYADVDPTRPAEVASLVRLPSAS